MCSIANITSGRRGSTPYDNMLEYREVGLVDPGSAEKLGDGGKDARFSEVYRIDNGGEFANKHDALRNELGPEGGTAQQQLHASSS